MNPFRRAQSEAPYIHKASYTGASCIDKLNLLSQQMEWPLIGDETCRFTEEKLYGALDLWLDVAADGVPYRREMSARLLRFYIPQLCIFERRAGEDGIHRYRVRLMGTDMVNFTMEMTGRYLDEAIDVIYLPRWYAAFDAVLEHRGPVRLLNRSDSFNKNYVVGESLAAPLLDNAGEATLVMTVTFFEGLVPWSRVASAAQLQLGLECLHQNVH